MGPNLHWFPEDVPLSKMATTLVALANSLGGKLLLGIAPRSGQIQGLRDPELAMDRVFQACLLVEPTLVLPLPLVQEIEGEQILHITVPDGLPNVYNFEGRYLWREGSQNSPIPPRRLRQLLLERGVVQFESRCPPEARLDDLDSGQILDYAETVGWSGEAPNRKEIVGGELLLRRGLLKRVEDQLRPTYAAVLLFGMHPQRWVPSASILAARFSGTTFGDRFVKQELSGTLPAQLRQAEGFVRDNLRREVRMLGLNSEQVLEYPAEAVRELLVNAVAHRDYNLQGDTIHLNIFADRLVVSSPGGLPGPVTLENLLEARFSRNAVIVQALSDLGFVERLGYGLDRVVAIMRDYGLPEPRFEEIGGAFRVTLYNVSTEVAGSVDLSRYRDLGLNQRQERALSYLGSHKRMTSSNFQELCPDVHPETLRRDFADLVDRGILLKIGDKKATYYILKELPAAGN